MAYMEETAAWTRTGRNGLHRVQADGFVAAGFRHRTSRDGDPHLHTHALVANSVRAADGRWRTWDGDFYGSTDTEYTLAFGWRF